MARLPEPDEAAIEARMREEQEALRRRELEAWQHVLDRAGIPPRYQRAHLETNCAGFADMPEKRRAHTAALDLVTYGSIMSRDAQRFCVLLTGPYGTGKTWLATATFKALMRKNGGAGLWRKFYGFVREVQGAYRRGSTESADDVLSRFQKTPVLFLDDVGDLDAPGETEDRRRLLYEVLDYRNDYLLPTILTTNLTGDAIAAQFGERTMQRVLEMCAMVGMDGKDYRADPAGLIAPGRGIAGPVASQMLGGDTSDREAA